MIQGSNPAIDNLHIAKQMEYNDSAVHIYFRIVLGITAFSMSAASPVELQISAKEVNSKKCYKQY